MPVLAGRLSKSASATLPTQLESTLLSRVPTHTYAECKISCQQPTQLHKEFHRIHNVGHSKKTILTWWHVELSTLNLLLLWLNIYLSNSFNSSIHVFHSKIALGWPCTNLGALLAQPQKNNDVQCLPSLPLPVSAGRLSYRQTYIKQVAEKHWCQRSIHMPVLAGRLSKGKPAISINLTLGVENKDEVGGGGSGFVCLCATDKLRCGRVLARWTQHAQPSPPFTQHFLEQ